MKPINYTEFQNTLVLNCPHTEWPEALKSLWFDARGYWEESHNIAQDIQSDLGNWIHAYLHRKEGDEWNAGYWYRLANKPYSKLSFDKELQEIVEFVLN